MRYLITSIQITLCTVLSVGEYTTVAYFSVLSKHLHAGTDEFYNEPVRLNGP